MWRCLKGLPRRLVVLLMQLVDAARKLLPTTADLCGLAVCLRPRKGSFSCLHDYRERLAPERRRLLFNLFVALIITVLLAFDLSPQFTGADKWIDWLIEMRLGKEPEKSSIPLGWIDIDDGTHREWKEPLFVPRKELAELIRFVLFDGKEPRIDKGARLLVVDIELARRNHSEEEDKPIIEVLQEYAEACKQDVSCPPVLLAASLRLQKTGLPEQRPSPLDDLVTFNPNLFFWASPLFDKDSDGVIRRWRLWEPVCSNGTPVALPSFQLLGSVILTSKEGRVETLRDDLESMIPGSCNQGREPIPGCSKPVAPITDIYLWDKKLAEWPRDQVSLSFSCDHLSRRILYATSRAVSGTTKTVNPWMQTVSGESRSLVARIPANTVLKKMRCNDYQEQNFGDLKDRAVFIGASYYDSRDLHGTPVGPMSGALILMNSMHSLLQHGEVHEPCLVVRILLIVVLVFMMSVFFTVWDSFSARVITSVLIYALLVPVTFLLFGSGLWLDFALPLFAAQLNQMFSDVRGMLCDEENAERSGSGDPPRRTNPG